FDLAAYGCPIMVDPGTFSYIESGARDYFRSTDAHNTMVVDGLPAAVPAMPFSWATRADGHLDAWHSSEVVDFLSCHHNGYERLDDPTIHRRRILFIKHGYWIIWDTLLAAGAHS